ncbi:uncharacterized protein ACBT57_006131 isoform 1-T1 [Dama dama]
MAPRGYGSRSLKARGFRGGGLWTHASPSGHTSLETVGNVHSRKAWRGGGDGWGSARSPSLPAGRAASRAGPQGTTGIPRRTAGHHRHPAQDRRAPPASRAGPQGTTGIPRRTAGQHRHPAQDRRAPPAFREGPQGNTGIRRRTAGQHRHPAGPPAPRTSLNDDIILLKTILAWLIG